MKPGQLYQYSFRAAICLYLLAGCAGQRAPEGGPVDTTPPEIVSISPPPNTTHFTDSRIALEFSEYVDRRSVEESIFISPLAGEVEFDWSGTEVEMTFKDSLKQNTTYVVTVGTDVVDINNRNRLAKAVSLAFSTGDKIDNGIIQGKVWDAKPAGVMIFGYRLEGISPDTLNISKTKPDYISQTGTDGGYSLPFLSMGTYRLFAVRDEFRNLVYDPETDAVGTASVDVHITDQDTLRKGIDFQLSIEDTTSPRLLTASAADRRHVTLSFSEPIDTASLSGAEFIIVDTTTLAPLKILLGYIPQGKPVNYVIVTDSQKTGSAYRVSAAGLTDSKKHPINPLASSKSFNAGTGPDTLPPSLFWTNIPDSMTTLMPDQPISFYFDDALLQPLNDSAFLLFSRDSLLISVKKSFPTPAALLISPVSMLKQSSHYRVRVKFKYLSDIADNKFKDSTRTFWFTTADLEKFGSIDGMFNDADTSGFNRYIIFAENITVANSQPKTIPVQRKEKYSFTRLTEGQYVLKAFQDLNQNSILDTGIPFPYTHSERFTINRDTIKVRARWPVEGVNIQMK
jgi:hypothetical protein